MAATVTSDPLTFRPLKIGAGGWVTGHAQHSDGTLVCRTDVYGGYIWDGTDWTQIVTTSTMPAGDVHQDINDGIYEIVIAPSNSSIVYMHYHGYVYKSTDQCATWVKKTAITGDSYDGANNGAQRYKQNKMAVDPLDTNIVYVGTLDNGLWRTLDGGSTWSQLTDVPVGTDAASQKMGVRGILFDPTSGSSSTPTRTSVIWAFSNENGYYRSTDGGTTWSEPASGPATMDNACFATDGALYAANGTTTVYKFSGGAWSSLSAGFEVYIPACDPNNASRVIGFGGGGGSVETTNAGSAWGTPISTQTRAASDIPWLAWTYENYMSAGHITFDKVTANKILFSEGIGFWTATLASGFTSLAWTSMTLGIEELVARKVYQPEGSRRIFCMSSDRDLFTIANPDVFPHQHRLKTVPQAINHGADIHALRGDVSKMVAVSYYKAASSSDGGMTWTTFPTSPTFADFSAGIWPRGSNILMVTASIWLAMGGVGRGFFRTTDAGATWDTITLPGSPDLADFTFNSFHDRFLFAIDGVDASTVYLYGANGIYRSTDAGANWTQRYTGNAITGGSYHAKLKTPLGFSGHLWAAGGHSSSGAPINNYDSPAGEMSRSTDGGTTWSRCGASGDILEIYDYAFGPIVSGHTYPVLWICGWVNSVFGIYYNLDANLLDASTSGTWYKVGDYPLGSLDRIITLDCDKGSSTWKRVFVGFVGTGYMYASENAYSSEAQTLTITTN